MYCTFYLGCKSYVIVAEREPMAEMRFFAFDDTDNCPDKRLENAQVMERKMAIVDELHDIVKERVMISHGAACFWFCEFGDSQVYLKTRRTFFIFS